MEQDRSLTAGQLPDEDLEVRRLLATGQSAAANALFDQIVARDSSVEDHLLRSAVLVHRAILAWRLGRIPLALELAADGWTELGNNPTEGAATAHTMSLLGYLLEGMGNHRAALDILRTSVRQARVAGNDVVLARCLQRLGGTLNFRAVDGPDERAEDLFSEARAVLAEGLELDVEPVIRRALLGAYGRSLAGVGELAQAEKVGELTRRLGTESGDLWSVSVGCWVLATVCHIRGQLEKARTFGAIAVSAAERANDRTLLLRFSQDLADICAELDDPVGEAAALRRSLAAARHAADTLREGLGQALQQRRLAAQAQRLATAAQEAAARDPLTGLTNRLGLESLAPAMLAKSVEKGRTPWLVLLDVDWFKGVNDDAGHAAGDAALREIAQLLRHECRSNDLVARWAGDEFVVLLGDSSDERDAGPAVAERIRAAVAEHDWALMLGTARKPTVSIGVASGPPVLDKLFAAADILLYEAKRHGRNRVEVSHEFDTLISGEQD